METICATHGSQVDAAAETDAKKTTREKARVKAQKREGREQALCLSAFESLSLSPRASATLRLPFFLQTDDGVPGLD